MKLEIEVFSREVVTPSSPTPPHLKNYRLSFLDQIIPPVPTLSYFFYPANDNLITNPEKSNRLKKSLSQALSLFYPLSGHLVGNSYVDCNDAGVTYVEAQVKNRKLFEVITYPIPEELSQFLPCDRVDAKDRCMVVQATFFSCGGLAIALEISHKVVDGVSYVMFLNSWAAFSRGDHDHVQTPKFESSTLFPPKDLVGEIGEVEKKENIITKRFVFGSMKIDDLRERYTLSTKVEGSIRPTRIEALSSFIGTRFMVATKAKDDTNVPAYVLRMFVDIRKRVVPPLSEYHFGNMVIPAIITVPSLEKGEDSNLVKKMRDAIRDIDGDTVAKIQHRIESLFEKSSESVPTVVFDFTSFCRFPVHEANFGWGIPMSIGGPNIPINNVAFFSNSLSGDGIDAWVNLKEDDMTKFEADEELLEYASNSLQN